MRIFMSHSSKQKLFVKELRRYLPDSFNLWIDEKEILIGKPIESTLKNAIENDCDFLILILDSYSVKSDWVKKEIDWALEKERKIKRTFLLTIVTEEEAIPFVQNKDVLSKKFLKCSGQEDIQIEALAKSLTSELLGLLCEIIDNRNNK